MLRIDENIDLYRYEIHSLIKAFYPAEDVKVLVENDPVSEKTRREHPNVFMKVSMERDRIAFQISGTGEEGNDFRRSLPAPSGADYSAKCKETKDALKSFLYQTLSEYTGT